jgi:hypothetical protein
MHAEVNRALWRWGAFGLRLPNPAELNVHDDAGGGGFGVRPSTHILIVAPRRRGLRNQPQRADPVTYSMKVPKSITLAH